MKLLLGIVVLGAVGSALYGIGVTVFGDPFMTVWVILSKVDLDRIPGIVAGGRMAGLSQNIIAFSYVLAAAVPLAFAFLVSGYRLRTRERTWTLWAALFFGLALMMTVLLLNATRSSILGAAGGVRCCKCDFAVYQPGPLEANGSRPGTGCGLAAPDVCAGS